MSAKRYAKQTVKDVIDRSVKLSNGCWICNSTQSSVLHNGVPTYLIVALFDFYKKPYNGKIVRTCKNRKCINPAHLISFTKAEKFWSNVNIHSDESICWEWRTLTGTSEYGETNFCGKRYATHRLAWTLIHGDIPDGMCVCHKCDNPPCCNPNHLFLGTNQDNIDDREAKGRNKMPHSLGENHGNHKLTEEQVREIRKKYSYRKYSYYKLSAEYGVSFGQIRNVVKGRDWSWLE